MYKILTILGSVAIIFLSTMLMSSKTLRSDEQMMNSLPQVVKSVPIPDYVELGGETVPIHIPDVRERLDRELMVNAYWHSNTIQNIKLAHRYFPIIEPILKEHGVPDDFKYLAVAESDLRNKTSYAGAKGYWQFMKAAGKEMNLEINNEVDERYHIEKSTHAAAKYIRKLKNRFGSWTLAAAAYNTGATRVTRYLKEQKADNYYDLNLGEETNRYLFRILAFKYILMNPEKYGFYIEDHEKYQPQTNYYTVLVDKTVLSWAAFARSYGISYRTLKVYNPWMIDGKLTVKTKKYIVKIPK